MSGYDKTPTVLTKELEASGIAVHYTANVELLPKKVDLVIYTPAIPAEQEELVLPGEWLQSGKEKRCVADYNSKFF